MKWVNLTKIVTKIVTKNRKLFEELIMWNLDLLFTSF